jgi:serine/threonine-protein kinase
VAVTVLAGRYEVGEVLGVGGMGEVRAGHDRRLQRAVAIKLLRADMAHEPAVRDRFENEARLAARLVHPHVVAVFDSGEEAGIPFLVMERLAGTTLADVIAVGPLSFASVRELGLQILDALGAAHAEGLIHRDVKPHNVMAAGDGCWKVGDFGIAKSLEMADQGLTMTGMIVGTPLYLAPERLAGDPATISGDLYSAGIVLYEAATGQRPFDPATPGAALSAEPVPVSEWRPEIPFALAAVIMRAIDRDPAARFATAAQMTTALRACESVAPAAAAAVAAPRPGATRVMPPPVSGDAFAGGGGWSGGPSGRPRRSHGLVFAAAGAVALIVISLIVAASGGHGSSNATPAATTLPTTTMPAATTATAAVQPVASGAVPAPLDAALRQLEQAVKK